MDDDSEPEESLTGPIAAKDRAASSLAKGPASKGPTADRRRGQPSVAECGHMSVHAPGVAGNPRIQWDVIEDEELPAAPRTTPKAIGPQAFGAEDHAPTDKVKSFPSRRDPSGPEEEGNYPLRGHGAAPTSPPGGVLRLMPPASARSACLTSSGLPPWADSGRPN